MLESAPRADAADPRSMPEVHRRVTLHTVARNPEQAYFLFRPRRLAGKAPVVVSVHGISRNAGAHATYLARQAQARGALIVAPLFSAARCPHYQRIGKPGRGERADHVLDEVLEDVSHRTGIAADGIRLFGYSGGAQFAHRYAMAYPEKVVALAVSSAGWYTFPDPDEPFPRGLKPSNSMPDLRLKLDRFLDLPIAVLVGRLDNRRDEGLNRSSRVDRRQGATRVERAARWAGALRQAALLAGKSPRLSFRIMPRSDHDFEQNVVADRLDERVFAALFDHPERAG